MKTTIAYILWLATSTTDAGITQATATDTFTTRTACLSELRKADTFAVCLEPGETPGQGRYDAYTLRELNEVQTYDPASRWLTAKK